MHHVLLRRGGFAVGTLAVLCLGQILNAQGYTPAGRPLAAYVVVPQCRAFSLSANEPVEIVGVEVGVVIVEQVATTTMDISLSNPGNVRHEGELVVPMPDGAVVRGFTFQGAASEPTAELLPKEVARKTYDAIVAKVRDPALLEFAGYNLVRSSVFPIEARGTQKVRLTYEHLLTADGQRVDYVLPRSESVENRIPWKITVSIKGTKPIATVYSPSHKLETTRTGQRAIAARVASDTALEPGSFRLSWLHDQGGVSASLLAYPDPKIGGGYFLLLAGLPAKPEGGLSVKREVTVVLDRSGSMNGEKMNQAREAALQVVSGLEFGETFNIIAYNEAVDTWMKAPVEKTAETETQARQYIKNLTARGGTNIHDALLESLRQKPAKDSLPIVLFLTDGLPTFGQTSEVVIRNVAADANPHQRRIYTFGVGVDVNTPLLEKIASQTAAVATFVLPKEDVEVKVSQVFARLERPILSDIEFGDVHNQTQRSRIQDTLPGKMPDLFQGDQLVVLGRYTGDQPITLFVKGKYLGDTRIFTFTFPLEQATIRNAFVPRLWASRKIAVLVDAIRQSGANGDPTVIASKTQKNPQLKELVDEIVRLSTEFGILTEYTAFLAREGTDLGKLDQVQAEAERNFETRAILIRGGIGSVNQEVNRQTQKYQTSLNYGNGYLDENMNRVSISNVQQVNDTTFYRRRGRWVDSKLMQDEAKVEPKRVVEFGSDEFRELVGRLAREGRQGNVALGGDILLMVDGQPVLVKSPAGYVAGAASTPPVLGK